MTTRMTEQRAQTKDKAADVIVSDITRLRRLLRRIESLLHQISALLSRAPRVTQSPKPPPAPRIRDFGARQVAIAAREIGVKESPAGSNSGPRVRVYQVLTGAFGAPWCASFSAWVAVQGGFPKERLPKPPAWVPAWLAAARDPGNRYLSVVSRTAARRGDRVIYNWDGGQPDHIGVVSRNLGLLHGFIAVEGNAGDAVTTKTRAFGRTTTFVRLHPKGDAKK